MAASPNPMQLAAIRLALILLMAGLVAGAYWAFRVAGSDYWTFWLKSGPVIGLATAALGWAWGGMDRNAGLVSADPLQFVGSAMQTAGLPLQAFGGHMRTQKERRVQAFDLLAVVPLTLILMVAIVGWLVLIAPAMYFAFLVFGAPSRVALSSRHRAFARLDDKRVEVVDGFDLDPDKYPRSEGWWDASMRDRPVSVASTFMAASLLVIDTILAWL